jgi:hypothetical protein
VLRQEIEVVMYAQSKPPQLHYIRLDKVTWLTFQSRVYTSIKNARGHDNKIVGRAILQHLLTGLSDGVVFEEEYQELAQSQQIKHDHADAVIMAALLAVLHPDQHWLVTKFGANSLYNKDTAFLAHDHDDKTPMDSSVPRWCYSPGVASYKDISTKYSGITNTDVFERRTDLYKVTLAEHRGDFATFRQDFESKTNAYFVSLTGAGKDVSFIDAELALHIVAEFDAFDRDTYGTACSTLRQANNVTVSHALGSLEKEWDARGKNVTARGDPNAKVLTIQAPGPSVSEQVLEAIKNLTARVNNMQTPSAAAPNNVWTPTGRRPLTDEEKSVFLECKKNGTCFKNRLGVCQEERCRFRHEKHVNVNVIDQLAHNDDHTVGALQYELF